MQYNDVTLSVMWRLKSPATRRCSQLVVYANIKENVSPHYRPLVREAVDSPHKGPVTQKAFPLCDVIMVFTSLWWQEGWFQSAQGSWWTRQDCSCNVTKITLWDIDVGFNSIKDRTVPPVCYSSHIHHNHIIQLATFNYHLAWPCTIRWFGRGVVNVNYSALGLV